jgi:hypothetical protein
VSLALDTGEINEVFLIYCLSSASRRRAIALEQRVSLQSLADEPRYVRRRGQGKRENERKPSSHPKNS